MYIYIEKEQNERKGDKNLIVLNMNYNATKIYVIEIKLICQDCCLFLC